MTRAVLSEEKKQFYENLGFDTSLDGSTMFDDLVEEVRILLDTDNINYSTIMKLLPSIEVEYYHFYYEVGRMKYLEDLKAFLDSRFIDKNRKKKSKTEYVKVFGTKEPIGVEKSIYIVAKLLNKERNLQKGNVKTLVKE
jgi:hypothetical protein